MKYDLVVVGSGPAGLAAASHAHTNGMKYVLLERVDHLSDTIYNYQARKYVMAEPMMIPARGEVPFQAGSRESILDAWDKHTAERKLTVEYKAEVKSVERLADGSFVVGTGDGKKYETGSVVLGMGTQG